MPSIDDLIKKEFFKSHKLVISKLNGSIFEVIKEHVDNNGELIHYTLQANEYSFEDAANKYEIYNPADYPKAEFKFNDDGSIEFDIIDKFGYKLSDTVINRKIDKANGLKWFLEELTALFNFVGVEYDANTVYEYIDKH